MGSVLKPSGSEVLRAANTCFHAPSLPRLLAFIERKMVSFSPRTFFLMMRLTPKQGSPSRSLRQESVKRSAIVVGGGPPRLPGRPLPHPPLSTCDPGLTQGPSQSLISRAFPGRPVALQFKYSRCRFDPWSGDEGPTCQAAKKTNKNKA